MGSVCTTAAKNGRKRSKQGVVHFITSDKTIQAAKTGVAVAIISKSVDSVGVTVNSALSFFVGVSIPLQFISLIGLAGVWWMASWADANTEKWRELVEERTGEEAADDNANESESKSGNQDGQEGDE